jgi:hypothetical protein
VLTVQKHWSKYQEIVVVRQQQGQQQQSLHRK